MSALPPLFDAHLHLRDSRVLPYHARYVKDALDGGVHACIDCATRPEEWAMEVDCALEVTTAYGLHPWYAALAVPDWLERLTCALQADPNALVGEIGIDGIRRVHDGGAAQRAALFAQLELAARLERPVVLHGARSWPLLLRLLEPWAERIPAWQLHGVNFSKELLHLPFLRHGHVWFSIGGGVLKPDARLLPELVPCLPLNRLLVETDSPDRFPLGGDPLVLGQFQLLCNQPGNLGCILAAIARGRGLPLAEAAEITAQNARNFLAARCRA